MTKLANEKTTATNSRFAKAGVSCFYDSEVLNLSFVHLMKFSAENRQPSPSPKPLAVSFHRNQENMYLTKPKIL